MTGPLHDVTILDLTRLLPGNYCTLLLADLGADVIKVEEPGRGDYIRLTPPMVDGEGAIHRALNRGKRSVTVNLKSGEGADVLRRLATNSDALVESYRPGVMDRLGVGHDSLADANPRLVYCALTGYGQDGPYRDRAGHDINYTGYAGVLHNMGPPDGPPLLPSVQVGDFAGGMAAAIGIVACLREAAASGRGRFVDVSMLDVVASWAGVLMGWHLATGEVPPRGGMPLAGGMACYRVYRTGDGRFLAVGALEPQFWRTLCERLDLADLVDEQYAEDQEKVAARLQEVFATRSRDEWVAELAEVDACVGPVNDIGEAMADPQVAHRGLVASVAGSPVGPGPAIRFAGDGSGALRPAPKLGQHTDEVLRAAGFEAQEVERLRASGAV
ncbi:MAG TPA: CaiB/BaiF CoA-transferase family protein [Actinomycetota bacterium]|nr:CaiB/BaiF CoA-transferase family protein [Actinomycetota bacterium]